MPVRAGRGRARGRIEPFGFALCAFLVAALAGCGAPEYTYVANSADRTYVKIPNSWRPIDQQALDRAFGLDPAVDPAELGVWHVAFDAAASPSPNHLIGWDATAPAAMVGVRDVPPSRRGQYSLDALRDLFLPVSPTARQRLAAAPGAPLSDFALIADEVLTPGAGLRGVHAVFRYRMAGGPSQTIDQTVYVNDDASKVYLFLVRCSSQCYQERQQEIESVVSSFTVREGT